MGAIASSAVSQYPTDGSSSRFAGGTKPRQRVLRRLKITGVTAADTATATVLGFATVFAAYSGVYGTSFTPCPVGVNPVGNGVVIGAGPSNETVYLVVEGSPKPPQD